MVAISLYIGNLHRVPDVPHRWLLPSPKISLKDFKFLLLRRSKALSRLRTATSSSSNPNPNPNSFCENIQRNSENKNKKSNIYNINLKICCELLRLWR
ncbi:hypothetical protein QN277_023611 [Acacia crassicarpa]|uniref:Uncharacterized protein n=1 Tax=Acacia crassicarpa TaxID=499986 RepID=A0AAE1MJ77_9FABA|nr:hypothetical protein QN277_023611 [Acacia crassicarpa]